MKYEGVYRKGYATLPELLLGLCEFAFYNEVRHQQALGYCTPAAVHRAGVGGGAQIVDRFGSTGQRQGAAFAATSAA